MLQAIRDEALPGIWSNGVKLARAGAATLESRSPTELVFRVKAPGRPVPWTSILYPVDAVWECNCPSRVDPCEHVVAAAITNDAAQSEGAAPLVTSAQRWASVVYRLSRVDGGLSVQRAIARPDGTVTPLVGSLAGLLANPVEAKQLKVEQHDLAADRWFDRSLRGALTRERLEGLMRLLRDSRGVLLDGRPVAVSDELITPRAIVEDDGDQVVIRFARDTRITEVLSDGVALVGDALCPLDETGVPPLKRYDSRLLAELSARIIPDLARRFPVEVKTRRLPKVDRHLQPRIVLELNHLEQGLSVLPTLVYGAPAAVRIDPGGKMTFLRGAVPLRDEAAETRLLHQLRDELDLVPGHRTTVGGPEMVKFADRLRRWRGGVSGDAAAAVGTSAKLIPLLRVDGGPDDGRPRVGFALDFQVEGGSETVGAEAVVRAWQEGLGLVPLSSGGWAPLPAAWLDAHGGQLAALLAARQEDGTVANHALPQLAALSEALEYPAPASLQRLRPLLDGFDTLPAAVLPEGLQASLREYQLDGVRWLQFLRSAGLGGVLADDMGLGKTVQTICAIGSGTLVVCPTSVLPNWAAELQRFRPALKVSSYHGPNRALDPAADVTLTTYALLRLDAETLSQREWQTVVLDEAQNIKNPDSQVARAAFGLKAEFKLALSGTPVENRLEELWSLMHFANRGLLGGRSSFQTTFAQPIAEGRADATAALRQRIKPFVLRRMKKEVAKELPPRSESVMHVTLDERERAVYDAVHAATKTEVVAALGQGSTGVMKALEALLRLRQAACHSALIPGQHAKSSSKIDTLTEALSAAVDDGHKALVFSQWTSLLDLIEPHLTAAEIPFSRLDGTTVDRGAITTEFQTEGGPPVLLMSLKAGGTGLNLTAADHVFLVDPWWNPAAEAQAADRAHRIGQERPVMVYRLVSQGTVEEKILQLQESKRALFEAALGDGGAATSLTKDDLMALLE